MIGRRVLLGAAGTAAVGALLSGCGDDDGPAPRVPVATGPSGGVYAPLGAALAPALAPGVAASAVRTAGSVDNLRRLRAGHDRLAFVAVDTAAQAQGGLGHFTAKHRMRALAGLYTDLVHLVVPANSSAGSIADLAGRTVSTGAPGSGTQVVADRLMAISGITARGFHRRTLPLSDSVAGLRAGTLDAFFWSGGLPTPAIGDLVTDNDLPIRLIDLGGAVEVLRSQYGEVYLSGSIPISVYGTPSVESVGIPNVLVVSSTMSDDDAYRLTAGLFAAKPRLAAAHPEGRQLDHRAALATYPLALHPGAERYYAALKNP